MYYRMRSSAIAAIRIAYYVAHLCPRASSFVKVRLNSRLPSRVNMMLPDARVPNAELLPPRGPTDHARSFSPPNRPRHTVNSISQQHRRPRIGIAKGLE